MFRLTDNALGPKRALFERARGHLPFAEQQAQAAALDHIRSAVHGAARSRGLSTEPIDIEWHDRPYLSIADTSEGQRVADHEFGTDGVAPSALLRNTARRADPGAARIREEHLRRGLGI